MQLASFLEGLFAAVREGTLPSMLPGDVVVAKEKLAHMLTGPFTDRLTVEVSRQLLFAIQYLADNEVVHNDLHAGYILVVQGDRLQVK